MTNKKIIIFILNFFGCALVFMSLTSYFPSSSFLNSNSSGPNPYNLQFSGALNTNINGVMHFATSVETTNRGSSYATLNLVLDNNLDNKFEIIISKDNSENFEVGTYKVNLKNEDDDEFAKISGVFGYLNRVKSKELPYYVEKGKVKITKINNELATGYIDLKLEDYNGESIIVQGDFIASANK